MDKKKIELLVSRFDKKHKMVNPREAIELWSMGKDAWNSIFQREEYKSWLVNFDGVDFSKYRVKELSIAEPYDLDFERMTFPNVRFVNNNWGEGGIHFTECDFSGRVEFRGFKFRGRVSFRHAKINGVNLNFSEVGFENSELSFEYASTLNGEVRFLNCDFDRGSQIRHLVVKQSNFKFCIQNSVFKNSKLLFVENELYSGIFLSNCKLRNCSLLVFDNKSNERSIKIANSQVLDCTLDFSMGGAKCIDVDSVDFTGTSLKGIDLDQWDLRKCKYELDDNSIRGTRFSPNARDSYSVLRRTYTGFNFLLILFMTMFAIFPYAFKAFTLSFISQQEQHLVTYSNLIKAKNPAITPTIEEIESIYFSDREQARIWEVVVGLTEERGNFEFLITIFIFCFLIVRGWVTLAVSKIREAEERSQHAPSLSEYKIYFSVHENVLSCLKWLVLGVAIIRVGNILIQPVALI